jgi:hypothetical protein
MAEPGLILVTGAGGGVAGDEIVDGHVLQLVEIFTLNADGEVGEIRIFTRPWLVTASSERGCTPS